MQKNRVRMNPVVLGIAVAILVFIFGFGAMLIMYKHWLQTDAMNYPPMKGLFDYKASLWGDAICLPLILGAGATYISVFHNYFNHRRKLLIPLVAGVIGGILGVMMQAQWLISDTTILNWSIPSQHRFNYAGWYHAAFFIVVCFAVSYVAAYIVLVDIYLKPIDNDASKTKYPHSKLYFTCQFIIWFFGLLFLHLHYIDDYSELLSERHIILLISIASFLILCGAKMIISKRRDIIYFSPVISAVLSCMLISLLCFGGVF